MGINISKMLPTEKTLCIDAKIADYNTIANLTVIDCVGYTKLWVQFIISLDTWTSAGDIICYGSFSRTGTYTAIDGSVENASFGVVSTDDAKEGLGEMYVVENVPNFVKIGWANTTAGSAGTISVYAVPFNQ